MVKAPSVYMYRKQAIHPLQGKIETCSVAGGDLGDHFLDTRPLFFLWFSIDFSFDFDASIRMFFTLILSLQKSITVLDF